MTGHSTVHWASDEFMPGSSTFLSKTLYSAYKIIYKMIYRIIYIIINKTIYIIIFI